VFRSAIAIAVAACLALAPSALAAGHAVTLSDAHETPCTGGTCTPDLRSVAVYYDSEGSFLVSATFYDALPAYSAVGALRVRVSLARRLAPDAASCASEAGDIRIEVGAYDGGSSPSTAANGVVYRIGTPGSLATTRGISPDRRTLTVTATSATLAGIDLRCTQADLADDLDASAVIRDPVPLAWFPGFEPAAPPSAPPPGESTAPASPAAVAAPAGMQRPSLVAAPVVRRGKKQRALLTCSSGRWKNATRFSFRWLRDGRPIARALARQYRVRPADRGHALRCRVTAGNAAASKPATSRPLRIG
jgi:hypothetical protein